MRLARLQQLNHRSHIDDGIITHSIGLPINKSINQSISWYDRPFANFKWNTCSREQWFVHVCLRRPRACPSCDVKAAFHNIETDTDILARILARMWVSVSLSVSWNVAFTQLVYTSRGWMLTDRQMDRRATNEIEIFGQTLRQGF